MNLIDSCIWISMINENDSCHQKAVEIFESLEIEKLEISSQIYTEVLTVFRNRVSDEYAKKFIEFLKKFKISIIIENGGPYLKATGIFFQKTKLSFVDAFLIATAKIGKKNLLTFDNDLQKAWKSFK